ncbi:MAG: DNA methyltransferase [Candidatus Margulisbacteria bacterium]|nr:DNA methyltransferase [Candidatus Margulisiibacteriota bacterium]
MSEDNFLPEITTAWSFPERGNWATHNPKYRGNWAPQIPKNLILKYTKENDIILDPMMGAGTTIIEAKLLNRNAIGIDINIDAVNQAKQNLEFDVDNKSNQDVIEGDVRDLSKFSDDYFDFILTHPPYLNIIKYSEGKIAEDLSNISSLNKFLNEFKVAVKEMYRVLKPNKYCAILIGDTRRRKHYVPLAYRVMDLFLSEGFILKEDIIKTQHNCKATPRWSSMVSNYDFYLIMHEHLFIFRKPDIDEDISIFKDSCLLTSLN